jgi:exodeoxyribonuclease VII small subunit
VRLFEDGMKLSSACKKELEQAEGRIQVLVEGKGGAMKPVDLELDKADGSNGDGEEADNEK